MILSVCSDLLVAARLGDSVRHMNPLFSGLRTIVHPSSLVL